ncbi:MAG TPA: hypothetical protein VM056_07455, partial [Terriglobales bacterium]|nr:hypothetical protein [Terriglobales bacterium]
RVLKVVDAYKPLHLSIVGGDPLVRYREVTRLLPELEKRDIHVQIVTSAFREIPPEWATIKKLNVCVSIDGLQPEHDIRRTPATYERILKNIVGAQVSVHCTVTGQMMKQPGYLAEFARFWSDRPQVKRIWFSLFTPQMDAEAPEILTQAEREAVVRELIQLRKLYPKIDMNEGLIRHFLRPPKSPEECIFAQTTKTLSADFTTPITPCQFGGEPDCSKCGCMASAGLARVGSQPLVGPLTVGHMFRLSNRLGRAVGRRNPISVEFEEHPSTLVQLEPTAKAAGHASGQD